MHVNQAVPLLFAGLIVCVCHGQPTQLAIDRNAGPARIKVSGETNRDYSVMASDALSSNWTFQATLTLTNSPQSWFDSASPFSQKRFYRGVKLDPALPAHADDFRLIDHQGK